MSPGAGPNAAPGVARERIRPFAHFRLAAYFAGVAVLVGSAGFVVLAAVAPAEATRAATLAILATAAGAAALGFGGVLFHRLRVDPIRWRETEQYLARIRSESLKYRALMEGAADMLLVVDPETLVVRESNARARELLGEAASAGAPLARLFEGDDLERLRAVLTEAMQRPGSALSCPELRLCDAGGAARIAGARLAAIDLGEERLVHVALRDLTHEKALERELQVRERLSSLGLLTAGVAHEINNPLEGIANYLSLIERDGQSEENRQRYLELVRDGFGRIRDHVRDLLSFARPDAGSGTADLAAVVERALLLSAFSDRFRSITVARKGLEGPLCVAGDARRLEQVVVNLLLNAAHALEGGGTIEISARRAEDPETRAAAVELAIEDDGPGIPAEDLPRIFDPFFTTGSGSGLGLAVSYGIVRAHGGSLGASNRPAGGARMTLRLPVLADAAPRREERG